jgi:hypothetical protein
MRNLQKIMNVCLAVSLVAGLAWVRTAQAQAALPEGKKAGVKYATTLFEVLGDNLMMKQKKGYVYVLFDAFPYRDRLSGVDLSRLAEVLLNEIVLKSYAKAEKIKLDVVEYSEKDSYGVPRFDTVKILGKFEAVLKNGKLTVTQGKLAKKKAETR